MGGVTLRLKHAWPSGECHLAEVMRKLGLLRAAIAEHYEGACNKITASKEYQKLCKYIAVQAALGEALQSSHEAWEMERMREASKQVRLL